MKNIHILPTNKPSRLSQNKEGLHIFEKGISYKAVNIYITNDEEIKDGWVYSLSKNTILNVQKIHSIDLDIMLVKDIYGNISEINKTDCKKIILTTDQSLDGVQAINDEFLEWFVKNPSCEEVEVESNKCLVKRGQCSCSYQDIDCQCSGYQIIIPKEDFNDYHYKETFESRQYYIPKEEPKQDCFLLPDCTCKEPDFDVMKGLCKICGNSIIHLGKRIKVNKQETLEEVAKRLYQYQSENPPYTIITPKAKIEGFIEGAIWQQEQDKNKYSEEDMRKMYDFGSIGHFTENESLEQFKKK
jgi:hypothetical protein